MTRLSAKIRKMSHSAVASTELTTISAHRKDLNRRLKGQQKAMAQSIKKGWIDSISILAGNIEEIERTLAVLDEIEKES